MRIKGHKFDKPNVEVVVIPRQGGDVVFKAQALLDYEEFEKLCPPPKVPTILRAGDKVPQPDFTDKDYQRALDTRADRKHWWIIHNSLKATEGLEWESVKDNDPSTWPLLKDELKAAKFSPVEIGRIIRGVWAANSLDEERVEEARKSFLTSQAAGDSR